MSKTLCLTALSRLFEEGGAVEAWRFLTTSFPSSLSSELLKMQSHALALLLVYLFLRVFLALGDWSHPDGRSKSKGAVCHTCSPSPTLSVRVTAINRSIEVPSPLPSSSPATISSEVTDEDSDVSVMSLSSLEDSEMYLEKLYPDSTSAERRRFLISCDGNIKQTSRRLQHYLEWRDQYISIQSTSDIHILPTRDRDYDVWVESCLIAMQASGEVGNIVLPRVIRSYQRQSRSGKMKDVVDRDGHRIFHMIPAMMDEKLAKQSTYTLAVALYLDRQIDRYSIDTITVCTDCRAGRGWPNVHAMRLVPFMKNSLKTLLPLFPERLHKCVVYPLPSAFFFVWTMISRRIDAETAKKIFIVSGKCTIEAPPPTEKLMAHLGEESARLLEPYRVSKFKA